MLDSEPAVDASKSRRLSFLVDVWAFAQAGLGLLFITLRFVDLPFVEVGRLPVVLIGIPHLIVAAGIWFRRRWSLWLGLAHTAFLPVTIFVAIWIWTAIFPSMKRSSHGPGGPGSAVGSAIFLLSWFLFFGFYWIIGVAEFLTLLIVKPYRQLFKPTKPEQPDGG